MRKGKRRGLSFLELMLAMTLTFLAISFLMGMFLTAIRETGRSRHATIATALAQSKLERLNAMAVEAVTTGTGQWDEFTYTVDVADAGDYDADGYDDPDLKVVTVTVTSPKGVRSTMQSLRPAGVPFFGIACCDAYPAAIWSLDEPDGYPYGWDDGTATVNPTSLWFCNPNTPMPAGGRPGGIAASADLNVVWAVDVTNQGIRSLQSGPAWSNLRRPGGLGRPTGIASNGSGDKVWVADEANRCLFKYKPSADAWSGPIIPVPAAGRLKGASADRSGDNVWVVDADNRCVRHYWPPTDSWDPLAFTNGSFDETVSVAVSGDGKWLFVMDSDQLHIKNVTPPVASGTTGWTVVDLDSKLVCDIPQGLAANYDGSLVWANPKRGPLFKYDRLNDNWYELDGP